MTATLLQSSLNGALADDQRTEDILRQRANIPDTVLADRRAKDVHITPDKALAYGLINGVREFALPQGNQIFQV